MKEENIIKVVDVMKTKFDLVDGLTTVKDALKTMKHVETKTLIIDKRFEEDEYGILLLSDIAKQVLARNRAAERINVYEIMSKPVISVNPEMNIRYCARLFDQYNLSRAPVVTNRKIVGIISFADMILKGMCKDY